MNKLVKIILFSFLLANTLGCEVDDICIEEVLTPKLIIRFYDALEPSDTKVVNGLYVWAENKDSLYVNNAFDSIALPINTSVTETKYLLSKANVVDTLYLNYINQEIFVSRSCGYKFNFELLEETHISNEWISDFETIESPQIIDNEQAAHIKIFH